MNAENAKLKEIFSTYNEDIELELEEMIMTSLPDKKDFTAEIEKSKKWIKTGFLLSIVLAVCYIAIYYIGIISKAEMSITNDYSPSTFTVILVTVLFFLMNYYYTAHNKSIKLNGNP